MFTKHPLTFVKGSTFKTSRDGGLTSKTLNASVSVAGASSPNLVLAAHASGQYNYWMSGLLPATPDMPDTTTLAYFYRDIYLHDNVGGSTVDIMSVFPFSGWELRGLTDKDLVPYETALNRLNLRELFPQISTAYLTDGFYCGSLVYDAPAKNFMDILTHDAMQCAVTPSSFNNIDPSIQVTVAGSTSEFLGLTNEYAKRYIASMPRGFVELLKEGSFVLDPLTTMFVGRRSLTDRAYHSYLHRLLPMYLIEKTMYRGTLTEATRRQRAMSHISAGDDIWTPTSEELRILVDQFMTAERDPLGGWVSTRNAIQVSDLRPGGDFWKWTDMSDTLTPYKLRALGTSEALLSGDSSYAAAESAYSTFLETCEAYRTHLTDATFYKKIFPLIGVANSKFKDLRLAKKSGDVVSFLYNSTNRENLMMPTVHWHKDLTGKAEDNLMDLLEKLTEKEIPIPIKMWLAAAGIDKDTLLRDAKENDSIRAALGMGSPGEPSVEDEEGFNDDVEDHGGEGNYSEASARLTSRSANSEFARGWRKNILARDFGPSDVQLTKTGKPAYKHFASRKATDENHRIAKIAAAVDKDASYRERLKADNALKGVGTVRGIL